MQVSGVFVGEGDAGGEGGGMDGVKVADDQREDAGELNVFDGGHHYGYRVGVRGGGGYGGRG